MIEELIKKASSKGPKSTSKASSVVISSRLRLARNLKNYTFPNRANIAQKCDILSNIETVLKDIPYMKKGYFFKMEELSSLEKKMLKFLN